MARPEQILNIHTPITQERLIPRLGIPIRFHALEKIDATSVTMDTKVMGEQLLGLFDRGETLIDLDKIRPVALHLFDDNTVLEDSLTKLKLGGQVQEIDVSNLQMGTFALHLLYRVKTTEGVKYFVSYVSRFSKDSKAVFADTIMAGDIAESDFQNLTYLHGRMQDQNKSIRSKYRVVSPLSYGVIHQYDKDFGIYTTEFEDKGELRIDDFPLTHEIKDRTVQVASTIPFYHYATTQDSMMIKENDLLSTNMLTLKRKLRLKGSLNALIHIPEFHALVKQQREMVLANAVLFLIGDHNFPERLTINAGDWMVTFQDKQMNGLTFVTTRGLLKRLSDEEWVTYILKMRETDKTANPPHQFNPFQQLSREDVTAILQEAKRMTGLA